jgi:uncharacterized protein
MTLRKIKTDFQVFAKPAGNACNLACRYCYYSAKAPAGSGPRMTDEILETYIRQHIQAHPGPVVRFSWHGGEPTLAGLDFFKRAVGFQKKYRPQGILIQNGIQTNGTLLDEAWCAFLKEAGFSVGLSLDGPQHLHDQCRLTRSGQGTHSRVMEGLALLKTYRIPHDILCVVHHHNVDHPLEVYHFFKTAGASYIGFLPVVNASDRVDPEKFGDFLCAVFDEWKAHDISRIRVQIIEEALATAMGRDHSLCVFRKECGEIPVVEANGDVYPCDHFVRPGFKLGNLSAISLETLMGRDSLRSFGRQKHTGLPHLCRTCEVLAFCNGGCPKDRIRPIPGSKLKLNHLCPAYKKFFTHCLPFAKQVQRLWQGRSKNQKTVPPGRNAPCPCGSGKKFKHCCLKK